VLQEFNFGRAVHGWIRTEEVVQAAIALCLLCCGQRLKHQRKDRNGADRFPSRAKSTHTHILRRAIHAIRKKVFNPSE
jgi:hypothetical protein